VEKDGREKGQFFHSLRRVKTDVPPIGGGKSIPPDVGGTREGKIRTLERFVHKQNRFSTVYRHLSTELGKVVYSSPSPAPLNVV
jgi:hypothetical protein